MRSILQSIYKIFSTIGSAVSGSEKNFTSGSINRAIFMLSVPMIIEMIMESLFAVIDIYFVGKVSVNAIATVALTESVIMIVYALSIGFSMAATAMVARRVGENKPEEANNVAVQAIFITILTSLIFSAAGMFFAKDILTLMGGEKDLVEEGYGYTMIMLAGNVTIMLLFLINAIFRGAGDASIAMRVLIVSNCLNIVLDPILIFGLGPIPAFGIEGAAIATTIGRGIGVAYQLVVLTGAKGIVQVKLKHLKIHWDTVWKIVKVSVGGIGQYMIGTLSWLFLVRISAVFGAEVLAGYAVAFRIIMFTILPSWGLSNAAATLVGQNLGAGQPDRAERSVWKCAFYNMIFLGLISIVFISWAEEFVRIFSSEAEVVKYGALALRVISCGYIFFAYGMVIGQAFNGAGDTKTPTIINLFCFWLFEVPMAYAMAVYFGLGPIGIFLAIAIASTALAAASIVIFKKGRWKLVEI
ncbi:MATE family efflux transporter [Fulvivirga kasyanovii]|uniref:Multidrug-efflux transporter n=1 Tax=Fulvivirga kasyanovii TaxID=396812 RepID=A0ABW9RXQ7_9BACT|nr:MATE family efflux transporter [Fulvivirga kasyanovii]MTI29049.1 MATE family efflux transporter [Fulvivirga kasyanovii]